MTDKKSAQIIKKIDGFLYSNVFPALVSVFVFLVFALKIQPIGLAVLVILALYILVRNRDISPLIPLVFSFVCMFRDFEALKNPTLYITLAPFVLALVYHFIRFPLKKPYLGKLFFPFFIVSLALFLGGLLSPYINLYPYGLIYAITVGPLLWFAYFLFRNYIDPPKDFNLKSYLAISVISSVTAMCLTCFLVFVENIENTDIFAFNIEIGYANLNNIGAAILLAVPFCYYMLIKTNHIITSYIFIVFFTFTIITIHCDGGSGVLLFTLPFMTAFTYLRLKKELRRKFLIVTFLIILAVSVFMLILTLTKDYEFFEQYVFSRLNENGRQPLYDKAIKLFKESPVFGAGLGYSDTGIYGDYSPINDNLRNFNFHSTFFHVLGTMGIFGIVAYFIYFYKRYQIICGSNSDFNLFVFFAFSIFESYGFIDTCEFIIVPCMLTLTIILTVTEIENAKPQKFNGRINAYYKTPRATKLLREESC